MKGLTASIESPVETLEESTAKKASFSVARILNQHSATRSKIKQYRFIRPSSAFRTDVEDFVIGYFLGVSEPEVELKDRIRMDVGQAIHETLQKILHRNGFLECSAEEYEEPGICSEQYGVVGKVDGILIGDKLFPKNQKLADKRRVLEIKTMNKYYYDNTNSPEDLSDDYRWQAELYQLCSGTDETIFALWNVETGSMKLLVYRHDPATRAAVLARIEEIWGWIAKRELPRYERMSREAWNEAIRDIVVPLSPAEIDYSVYMKPKESAEEKFLAAWTGPTLAREHVFHPTRKWRFDFAIEKHKIAIEIDGQGRHQTMKGFSADCEKLNAAAKLGWRILRYTATEVNKCPQCVVDDVMEILA